MQTDASSRAGTDPGETARAGTRPAPVEGIAAVAAKQRLFVSVMLPDDIRNGLESLDRPDVPGLRWTAPEQWHLTVRFLGQEDPSLVIPALRDARLPVTHVRLGPRVRRLSGRVAMVPATGLADLARVVRHCTKKLGVPIDRRFGGHVTLARWRGKGSLPVAAVGQDFEETFVVHEINLMRSVLDTQGAIHTSLARFPVPSPRARSNG